ncbi:MAG: hypothetical protein LBC40_01555 [Dysgonamonadaceae bacterium]|nr:hypothetical protein [Dysgonamonadaceae bacterium]
MKTKFFLFCVLAVALSVGFAACSDDDEDVTDPTPDFSNVVPSDTVHLAYKGDTVDLNQVITPFFASELNANSGAVLSFSLIGQPEKREVGFGTNGEWAALGNVYQITPNGANIIAVDSLPAFWNLPEITNKYRELKPAVLEAKLTANGKDVALKKFFVVQDSVVREIIKIEAPVATDPLAYAVSNNVLTCVINSSTTFSGSTTRLFYSDGKSGTGAPSMGMGETGIVYTYSIAIDAVNDNSSATVENNVGNPISQDRTYQYSYYINRSTSQTVNKIGENGYFDIYPYGTSKNDWRAVHLVVKPVNFIGIIPLSDYSYLEGAVARRFRTGVQAGVTGNFYAFETVSDGPPRPYQAADNGGNSLLVVADSWNTYNDTITLEGYITGGATGTTKANSLLKPGIPAATDNKADYAAFYQVRLTNEAKEFSAGTTITFKLCPKNHFDAEGKPDPAWTIDVTTKIYAN